MQKCSRSRTTRREPVALRPTPVLVAVAALLVLAALGASAGTALPGNRFPVTDRTLFFSNAAGDDDALLLTEAPEADQSSVMFIAPGVDALGLVTRPNTQSWVTGFSWDKDLEVLNDTVGLLYFRANAQGLSIFEVRLYDVAPDGTANLVDSNQQQFVTALSPVAVRFPLHTAGVQILKGHLLQLEVFVQTANAIVVLDYGGSTPSALASLSTRWLDSDGDGMPDSDEVATGRNPLNPNDSVDRLDEGKDNDADGLADRTESTIGTDPAKPDTDGDGFGDGVEVYAGSDPLDAGATPHDANQNGLPDIFETSYFNSTTIESTTGPCMPGPGCIDPFDDPDRDGCNNLCEAANGTDPSNPDTDGDGVSDGDELEDGTDPTSAVSVRGAARGLPEPVASGAFFAVGSSLVLLTLLRRPFA